MQVALTITDPGAFTAPWTAVVPLDLQVDTEMLETVCETSSEGWVGSLSDARATAVSAAADVLARYVGVYSGMWGPNPRTVRVRLDDNVLRVNGIYDQDVELIPQSSVLFAGSDGLMYEFLGADGGRATHVIERHVSGDYTLKRQDSAEPAAQWMVPRTPWGDPDLEGIWPSTRALGIPLERSSELGTRNTLTDEEFAARVALATQQQQLDEQPFDASVPTTTVAQAQAVVSTEAVAPELEARFNGQLTAPTPVGPPPHYESGTPSRQASLIVDPPDGRLPPLTSEGARRWEALRSAPPSSADDPFRGPGLTYQSRCISRGVVGSVLPNVTDSGNQLVQAPGYVVIRHEMIHEARVIPLDGRPHIARGLSQDMGDSRGRWDGDTLVVETTNFKERSVYRNANPATLKVVERLVRVSPTQVRWTVTLDDPSTWTRPWTFSLPLTADDQPMPAYECHEGNYGLKNILSAARAEEREAARTGRPVGTRNEGPSNESGAPAEGR
jgi:hypothetical protein